jgi:predicted regulator of Ras-like GTPase activity (Roadblock/LC7/MglB family)
MIVDLVLREEDIYRFNVILTKLVDKARIDYVYLINKSGRLLTSQSESSNIDKSGFSALVAGSFASTTCIAQMIGETEFTSMFHQGKKKHIYIAQVDDNTILTLIFDRRTTLDKVKLYTKEYTPELQAALKNCYGNFESDPDINLDVLPRDQRPAQQVPHVSGTEAVDLENLLSAGPQSQAG